MIVLIITAWILCAIITCGVMMHVQPDEWLDSQVLCMVVCLVCWWLFAAMGIGYLIIKQLSKLGLFVAGFLGALISEVDEE